MNKKLTLIIVLFSLLTLGAAGWLVYETATLETRLLQIDKETQQKRLVELSLPRLQAEIKRLLEQERNKLGYAPPVGQMVYDPPTGNMPDFVRGYFMLTPAGLQVPEGQEALGKEIESNDAIIDTIRRKAFNPAAPVYDHSNPTHATVDLKTHMPVFGVQKDLRQCRRFHNVVLGFYSHVWPPCLCPRCIQLGNICFSSMYCSIHFQKCNPYIHE